MTISIDTNVLVTLWDPNDPMQRAVAETLNELRETDNLIVCGMVYAELLASQRTPAELQRFFHEMQIAVEWEANEAIFRTAGIAFRRYVERRQTKQRESVRRILTDFLIGAQAQANGHAILTRDKRLFRAAFPAVPLLRIDA